MGEVFEDLGVSVSAGGGVVGFSDGRMQGFADPGGTWDARVAIGTHQRFAVEGAYTGGSQTIDALGLDTDALLVSNGLEAAIRGHLAEARWIDADLKPYILAGVGFKRYSLAQVDYNTSDIGADDNVVEIPVGIGVVYRYKKLMVDGRGVFRPTVDADLIKDNEGQETPLHNLSALVRVGLEF